MNNNSLAFIALCNEYCSAIENIANVDRHDFISNLIRLLPRIYISANDLTPSSIDECYVDSALQEDQYELIRNNLAALIGKDDTYLEVFEEDMKYSDTPIAASISENLADLFQVFYNMLETVRYSPEEVINEVLVSVKDDFGHYWSRILCNVLRALNYIYFNSTENEE